MSADNFDGNASSSKEAVVVEGEGEGEEEEEARFCRTLLSPSSKLWKDIRMCDFPLPGIVDVAAVEDAEIMELRGRIAKILGNFSSSSSSSSLAESNITSLVKEYMNILWMDILELKRARRCSGSSSSSSSSSNSGSCNAKRRGQVGKSPGDSPAHHTDLFAWRSAFAKDPMCVFRNSSIHFEFMYTAIVLGVVYANRGMEQAWESSSCSPKSSMHSLRRAAGLFRFTRLHVLASIAEDDIFRSIDAQSLPPESSTHLLVGLEHICVATAQQIALSVLRQKKTTDPRKLRLRARVFMGVSESMTNASRALGRFETTRKGGSRGATHKIALLTRLFSVLYRAIAHGILSLALRTEDESFNLATRHIQHCCFGAREASKEVGRFNGDVSISTAIEAFRVSCEAERERMENLCETVYFVPVPLEGANPPEPLRLECASAISLALDASVPIVKVLEIFDTEVVLEWNVPESLRRKIARMDGLPVFQVQVKEVTAGDDPDHWTTGGRPFVYHTNKSDTAFRYTVDLLKPDRYYLFRVRCGEQYLKVARNHAIYVAEMKRRSSKRASSSGSEDGAVASSSTTMSMKRTGEGHEDKNGKEETGEAESTIPDCPRKPSKDLMKRVAPGVRWFEWSVATGATHTEPAALPAPTPPPTVLRRMAALSAKENSKSLDCLVSRRVASNERKKAIRLASLRVDWRPFRPPRLQRRVSRWEIQYRYSPMSAWLRVRRGLDAETFSYSIKLSGSAAHVIEEGGAVFQVRLRAQDDRGIWGAFSAVVTLSTARFGKAPMLESPRSHDTSTVFDAKWKRSRVKVGEGAFGVVWKTVIDGKAYAVKEVVTSSSPTAQTDLIREMSILKRLSSPFLVRFYGIVRDGEKLGMVMTFMSGGSLRNLVHPQLVKINIPLPEAELRRRMIILEHIAGGLSYLHSCSPPVIHRDLKPGNVLLDATRTSAKLADFGLSTLRSVNGKGGNRVCGTFGYMSPELFRTNSVTEGIDTYAFGVVLIETLTGSRPWSHVREEAIPMHVSVKNERPRIRTDANVPGALVQLARACWRTDPTARPAMWNVLESVKSWRKSEKKALDEGDV